MGIYQSQSVWLHRPYQARGFSFSLLSCIRGGFLPYVAKPQVNITGAPLHVLSGREDQF